MSEDIKAIDTIVNELRKIRENMRKGQKERGKSIKCICDSKR